MTSKGRSRLSASPCKSPPCSIVLVSNEVGSGVVPAYPSGRRFRDLLGEMNQSVARVASNVLLLVAGLPLVLKGRLEELSSYRRRSTSTMRATAPFLHCRALGRAGPGARLLSAGSH